MTNPNQHKPADPAVAFTPPRDRRGRRTASTRPCERRMSRAQRGRQHVATRHERSDSHPATGPRVRRDAPIGLLRPLATVNLGAVAASPGGGSDGAASGMARLQPVRTGRHTPLRAVMQRYLRVLTGPRGCG